MYVASSHEVNTSFICTTVVRTMRGKSIYTAVMQMAIPYGSVCMHDRRARKFSSAICMTVMYLLCNKYNFIDPSGPNKRFSSGSIMVRGIKSFRVEDSEV